MESIYIVTEDKAVYVNVVVREIQRNLLKNLIDITFDFDSKLLFIWEERDFNKTYTLLIDNQELKVTLINLNSTVTHFKPIASLTATFKLLD